MLIFGIRNICLFSLFLLKRALIGALFLYICIVVAHKKVFLLKAIINLVVFFYTRFNVYC